MAIFWILLLGTILSFVPLVKADDSASTGIIVSHAIRLASYIAAMLIVWLLFSRTTHQIPDDEGGLAFLRGILRPSTALLIVFVSFRLLEQSDVIASYSVSRMSAHWIGVLSMVAAASWLTVSWVRSSHALIAFCEHLGQGTIVQSKDSASEREGRFHLSLQSRAGKHTSDETIPLRRPVPKRTLGRYRIVKELGRGSMGVVYLGEDPTIHRPVAIKTMRLDQAEDSDLVKEVKARFFHEAESTGRLSHPNIVTIYDAGEEEDLGYIAMEFLEGTTLKASCKKDALLPVRDAVTIAAIVADALDYAHRQGIVHRDVKPSNIMLTKEQVVKVTDFGIARITTSTKTQTTMIMGTPSYMSPEQVVGEKVDGRADIFSLGVVLFELLTSEKPFQAENITALLFKIAHEAPQSARMLRPGLPPNTEAILERALQKNADNRYQQARELAQELRACVELLHV